MLHASYQPTLVVLSLAIAVLASYTTVELALRVSRVAEPRLQLLWRGGGAIAMGSGIWSMHFVGMLAAGMPGAVHHDLVITAGSLLLAIGVSYLSLAIAARPPPFHGWQVLGGGIVAGLGISGMHYTGMAAMQLQPGIHYDPLLVAASIAIAVGASLAAMYVGTRYNRMPGPILRLLAAVLMGTAIAGMHYTGMAAAHIAPHATSNAATWVDSRWLGALVAVAALGMMVVTIVLARYDARTRGLLHSVTQLHQEVALLSTLDPLTRLPNRGVLAQRLAEALARPPALVPAVAVLALDIDRLKTINEALGYAAGDEVLRVFAQRLSRRLRSRDTLARAGGDEFVALLDGVVSPGDAERRARELADALQEDIGTGPLALRVTACIGVAVWPYDGDSVELLLQRADIALGAAKAAGANTLRQFTPELATSAGRALEIRRALHAAGQDGRLALRFQPKFDFAGQLRGAEVLLRLTHPRLGPVQPAEFIPIAEQSGDIIAIGYWVLRETCRHLRRWRLQGLPPLKLAINLSAVQLRQDDLVAQCRAIAVEEGVGCDELVFEITESVAMNDADRSVALLHELARHGFEVSIDDFGTGYSSLAYLQQFRACELKIDQRFTRALADGQTASRAIVSAMISMAHALDMRVVAEGVETSQQREALRSLGCDELQGFLLSRPLDAAALNALRRTAPADIEPRDVDQVIALPG